jgi:hypothetical protein
MQAVVNFLSARDLCAISWTCARMHNIFGMRDAWHAQVRARFPYKRFVGRVDDDEFDGFALPHYNPRKFLLALESRDHARVFHDNSTSDAVQHRMIRGDIFIDFLGTAYVFSGAAMYPINRGFDLLADVIDLGCVVNVPLEFSIGYYSDIPCEEDVILFHIDKRAKLREIDLDTCTFECDDTYQIMIFRDNIFDGIKNQIADGQLFLTDRHDNGKQPPKYYIEPFH